MRGCAGLGVIVEVVVGVGVDSVAVAAGIGAGGDIREPAAGGTGTVHPVVAAAVVLDNNSGLCLPPLGPLGRDEVGGKPYVGL